MNERSLESLSVSVAILLLLICPAYSSNIMLRIEASNPAERQQTVNVKSYLPSVVQPADIIDLAGLTLGYDVKKASYYVYGKVELEPKGKALFEVKLGDRWLIPSERLDDLRKHAETLNTQLRSSSKEQRAIEIERGITNTIEQINIGQRDSDIANVRVEDHINAYKKNASLLQKVKKDIVELENLALSAGRDPESLLNDPEPSKPLGGIVSREGDYKKASIKITITNPSPTEPRHIPVRYELPREIEPGDVVDAGGLKVGTDAMSGVCYVHQDSIEIPPEGTVGFDLVVRDKWNVNDKRIGRLQSAVTTMLTGNEPWTKYKSTMTALENLRTDLDQMALEKGPEKVDENYVAFYRNQAQELDRIENMLNRIENAPCRVSGLGTTTPAPNPKTTWGVIYTILIFLAVMSAIVVLKSLRKNPS